MSRTTRNWCPRSTLSPLPSLVDVEECSMKEPHLQTKLKNESMTWQQKKDFGNPPELAKPPSGRPHWKPLAGEEASTVATEDHNSWLAQQAEFPNQPKQPRRKARGKAAAHPASAVEPSQLTRSPQPNTGHANKDLNPPYKKPSRSKKKKAGNNNMAAPLNKTGWVYVAPHLRNRKANNGKVDSAHSNGVAINGLSVALDQSKAAATSNSQPTLNGAIHQNDSSSSLPTTSQEPEQDKPRKPTTPEPVVYNGWDEPKAEHPAVTKNPGKPRWPRGPQPYKKNVWPKAKDMKYISSDSSSDGGISFKSNSNGDPEYDIKKLTDWNGDWLPAPETWIGRKSHADRHLGAHIEQWCNTHPRECMQDMYFPADTFASGKELAPRYWLEVKTEGATLGEVWKKLVNSETEPKPVYENDLIDYLPWWELYEDVVYQEAIDNKDGHNQQYITHLSSYLHALDVPDARVNYDDEENPSASWMLASAEEKVQESNKRIAEKHRKMMVKRSRPVPEPKLPVSQMLDRRLRPEANIYLRPVQAADIIGIAEIYNFHVRNTICAFEFDERTNSQIAARIHDITSAGLPYLVAVSKSNQSRVTPGYVNEKIVGYINLDDYCDQSTMFRYTFEMELFVHPGFISKGIGKCLVDRLLEMADTSYRARGGYEYVNDSDYLKTGPSRVIKTILLNVHHENGRDLDADWQGKFLSACKFVRVARLPKVGYKHDKVVDVSIFAHHTKEDIDPSTRPTVAG